MAQPDEEKASLKHEQLWAPWRMAYLEGGEGASPECFLCAYGRGEVEPGAEAGAPDIVVWRGQRGSMPSRRMRPVK